MVSWNNVARECNALFIGGVVSHAGLGSAELKMRSSRPGRLKECCKNVQDD